MATVGVDATNRGVRSLVQGLGIDVVVAIVLSVGAYVATKGSWDEMEWILLSYSVFKSGMQAVVAYVMRRWLDRTRVIPESLTPPSPVLPPDL